MHFLQTFVMQDSWKDSEMINTRYCAAAYFMQPLHILHENISLSLFDERCYNIFM